MTIDIKTRCPKCGAFVAVHEHRPDRLPAEIGGVAELNGKLYVVTMAEWKREPDPIPSFDVMRANYTLTSLEPSK
jgi:hypothetical protein